MPNEYMGQPITKVIVRKKQFQWVMPPVRDFDIEMQQFSLSANDQNFDANNVYYESSVGALMVKPLLANRSNYLDQTGFFENLANSGTISSGQGVDQQLSSVLEQEEGRYQVDVPLGADPETIQEKKKRVWVSKPTISQKASIEFTGYTEPWELTKGQYDPLWEEEASGTYTEIGSTEEAEPASPVFWLHQKNSDPNVEWFLHQKNGNFTNEPFWIDVVKGEAGQPDNPKVDHLKFDKFRLYENRTSSAVNNIILPVLDFLGVPNLKKQEKTNPVKAFFGVRIGWSQEDPNESLTEHSSASPMSIVPIANLESFRGMGPFDIIFPIDGQPFIWDHMGREFNLDDLENTTSSNGVNENENTTFGDGETAPISEKYSSYRGDIASINTDPSWILRNDIKEFRLFFLVMRGKLIIRSTFSTNAWVFPRAGSQEGPNYIKKYSNFYVPPSKVCLIGRGFKFRFNFNPMEFNVPYNYENPNAFSTETGNKKEKKPHSEIKLMNLKVRPNFPNSESTEYSYEDIDGKSDLNNEAIFTKIPNGNTTNTPDSSTYSLESISSYGFDVVSMPYEQHGSVANAYTSMMIPISEDATSIKSLVNVFLRDPTPEENIDFANSGTFGFSSDGAINTTNLFKNKTLILQINCSEPSFSGGLNTVGISKRFASPIVWRIKGRHGMPRLPEATEVDVTPIVKSISYSTDSGDFSLIRQKFNITCLIPKDYQTTDNSSRFTGYRINGMTRQEILDWLKNGIREVEVWLGWAGSGAYPEPALKDSTFLASDKQTFPAVNGEMVKVFTGITMDESENQTFPEDTVTLNCIDKIEMLEKFFLMNFKIFDGENVDKAFLEICTVGGLPEGMFGIVSDFASQHILPTGFNILEYKMKIPEGTSLLAGAMQITNQNLHVIRTQPDGTIVLTDIYSNALRTHANGIRSTYAAGMISLDELEITHPSYSFYVNGRDAKNPWQRIYENFNFTMDTKSQFSRLDIITIDRNAKQAWVYDSSINVDFVENPEAKGFAGFIKTNRYKQPALGDKAHIDNFRDLYVHNFFRPIINVKFTIYGRPTLRPLDIIEVVHQDPVSIGPEPQRVVKYRVVGVSGTIDPKDPKYGYKMDVSAQYV